MIFIIKGKYYELKDLDPKIDNEFVRLNSSFLSNHPYKWDDFKSESTKFFDKTLKNSKIHDDFFNNFTIIWQNLLKSGKYDEAETIWTMALSIAIEWEMKNPNQFIHKGTPFYFWGVTVILRGNLEKGYSLMHQALQEDIRTTGCILPNTPSLAFAMLDYSRNEQAFKPWLIEQAVFINKHIEDYCESYGSQFNIEMFRINFLNSPPSADIIYLFSYIVAKLLQIQKMPPYILRNDFASQMQLELLFNLSLVIDAVIKVKNPKQYKFIDLIAFLAKKSKLTINKTKLRLINKEFNHDFMKTLSLLKNGGFIYPDFSSPSGLEVDIAITYGIRNRGAHDPSSISSFYNDFQFIEQMLFNVLFLSIEIPN